MGAALCFGPHAHAATKKTPSSAASKRHSARSVSTAKSAAGKGSAAKRRAASSAHSRSHTVASTRGSSSRSRGRHPLHKQPPWTRQHLEPDRVTEIQQALGRAGYFHGQPTGQWDEPTRQAMRRYQADNKFGATGLPDSRSLMKLGLGPHALPEDVGRSSPAAAILNTSPNSNSDSTPQ